MRYSRYDINDFIAVKNNQLTLEDVAKKYGTSTHAIKCAMSRLRLYKKKVMVRLITPYKEQICGSINECAKIVGVSSPTINSALKGKRIPLLEELEIKVEVYDQNAKQEYDD